MKNKLSFPILTGCIALFFLTGFSVVWAEENMEYRFERLWPKLEQPWYFNLLTDIAIADDNSVYVAEGFGNRIQQFSADGDFIRQWGSKGSETGQFDFPSGLAIAIDNNSVYVADRGNHRIQQFTADGIFIRQWGK